MMGFCLFYLFWGAVQCELKMLWNCCDFEEGCPIGLQKENKILLIPQGLNSLFFVLTKLGSEVCLDLMS